MKEKKRGRPSYAEIEKRKLREAKKAERLAAKQGTTVLKEAKKAKNAKFQEYLKRKKPATKFKVGMEGRPSMSRDASAENESGLMQAVINLTSACMQLIKDNQTLIREVCAPLDIKFKQGMVYSKDEETEMQSEFQEENASLEAKKYKSAVSPKVIVDGAKKVRKAKAAEESLVDDLEDELDLDEVNPTDEFSPGDEDLEDDAPVAKKKRGRPAKQKALPAPVIEDEDDEDEEDDEDLGFSDEDEDDDLSDVPFGAEPPRKQKKNGKIQHSPDLEDILS